MRQGTKCFLYSIVIGGCLFLYTQVADAATNVSACGTLNTTDETYTLTQDVSSNDTCFMLTANNVTLNLNGYTISYANTSSGIGISLGDGGIYTGITIHNGAITGGHQEESHAIYYGDGRRDDLLIYDLTISVGGVQTNGISLYAADNIEIHDVDITMDSEKENQCSHYGGHIAGIGMRLSGGDIDIYNNSITGNGMLGISISDCYNAFTEDMRIHDNTISLWSPVRDGYAINIAGRNNACSDGTKIYSNTIDQVNGRGIMIAGWDVSSDYGPGDVEIYENNITIREGWDCEYDASGTGIGLRIRFGAHDIYAHDNEIYGFAGTGVAVGSEPEKDGSKAFGIYTGSGSPYGVNNRFENNYIEVTTNDVDYPAIGLYVGGGHYPTQSMASSYTNNTFKSNNWPVRISYNDGGGYNASFNSNTIIKGSNPLDFHTYILGFWIVGAANVDFLNTATEGGADPYDLSFVGSCEGSCAQFEDVTVSWIIEANVVDASGNPVQGATVQVQSNADEIVGTGTTNSSGTYQDGFVSRLYEGEVTATYTSSTPHTVTVSKTGYQTLAYDVNLTSSKTVNFTIESTESTTDPTVTEEEYVSPLTAPTPESIPGSDQDDSSPDETQQDESNGSALPTPIASAYSFFAYDRNLRGGYAIASGNVLGDSKDEIVTGTGDGMGPHVQVFDSQGNKKAQFFAYDSSLRNGVAVSACDVNADGYDEIITAQGQGGWPLVRIFDGYGTVINDGFYVLDGVYAGGVHLSCGDTDGDGTSEIVVAARHGGGPHVLVYSMEGRILTNFMAYDPNFRGGINVTTIDMDGDGKDEIVTGPQWGAPHVQIFQIRPNELKRLSPGFYAFNVNYRGGVQVSGLDTDGDGTKELIVGVGDDATPLVRRYNIQEQLLQEFFAFGTNYLGGVMVAGGDIDADGEDEVLVMPRSNGGPNVRIIEAGDL